MRYLIPEIGLRMAGKELLAAPDDLAEEIGIGRTPFSGRGVPAASLQFEKGQFPGLSLREFTPDAPQQIAGIGETPLVSLAADADSIGGDQAPKLRGLLHSLAEDVDDGI